MKWLTKVGFYLLVAITVVWCLVPFLWLFLTSIKPDAEIFATPPRLFPKLLYLGQYERLSRRSPPFRLFIRNSFVVASSTTIIAITVGSFAGYAIARMQFRGKTIILGLVLSVSMFPGIAIVGPIWKFFRNIPLLKINLLDTYPALITPYTSLTMPLSVWILTNFFREIPLELQDAAKVDGCTHLQTFYRIILPLAAPGVFTAAILIFIYAWNEFLFALLLTTSPKSQTLPVAIALFPEEFLVPTGEIAAASVVATIPLVILVFLFQRRIIQGLTAGAVKG